MFRILRGGDDSRLRATWRIVVALVLWIVLFVVLRLGVSQIPGIATLSSELVVTACYLVALGVTLAVSARWLDHRGITEYGFEVDRQWVVDFVGALAIGVVTQGLMKAVYLGLGWAQITAVADAGSDPFLVGVVLTLILLVGVGVWEETLFRGVFITNAVEGIGARVDSPTRAVLGAWLGSSALFGALHVFMAGGLETAAIVQVLSTTISGLYFGLAYVLTDSLAFPIGLHVSTNFAAVSLFGRASELGSGFATLIRFEREFTGIWVALDGFNLLYATSLLGVVVAWVYVTRGTVAISDSLLDAAAGSAETDRESTTRQETTTDPEADHASS